MYKQIALKLTSCLIENHMGKKEYAEAYAFGFENIVSTVANCIFVSFIGYLTGFIIEVIIYMIFYGGLRNCSGGYHRKTHLSCIVIYTMFAISHIVIAKYLIA